MVYPIFILVVTVGVTPKIPDSAVFDAFCEQLNRDDAKSYELRESLVVTLKEESEIYLTSIINCISDYYEQIKMYNAVPETTQHNYKRDFKSLLLKIVFLVVIQDISSEKRCPFCMYSHMWMGLIGACLTPH